MVDQFQIHLVAASGTDQRISVKGFEEELYEGLAREDVESKRVRRLIVWDNLGDLPAHRGVADVAVEAVVPDALEALWEDVLDHAADEAENRKGVVLDYAAGVVTVPVTN